MRRAAKLDNNQAEIVSVLEDIGASVQSLAPMGRGAPDLLVGYRGKNILIEVKNKERPPSARRLTPAQRVWHRDWRGRVYTVICPEDAIAVVLHEARQRV